MSSSGNRAILRLRHAAISITPTPRSESDARPRPSAASPRQTTPYAPNSDAQIRHARAVDRRPALQLRAVLDRPADVAAKPRAQRNPNPRPPNN
jgi:hypothetical protein